VPFECCLSLVATRQVVLTAGWASVTVAQLPLVIAQSVRGLSPVFYTDVVAAPDVRLELLAGELSLSVVLVCVLTHAVLGSTLSSLLSLLCPEWFSVPLTQLPPCVERLHAQPRRLSFSQRVVYGRFLSSANMPVSKVVELWRPVWRRVYGVRWRGEAKGIESFWQAQVSDCVVQALCFSSL
jgi:hypothetical protein